MASPVIESLWNVINISSSLAAAENEIVILSTVVLFIKCSHLLVDITSENKKMANIIY